MEILDPSCDYTEFGLIGEKKSALTYMHGRGFSCEHGIKGKYMCHLVFKQELHKKKTCPLSIILFKSENVKKKQCAKVQGRPLNKDILTILNTPCDALSGKLMRQHSAGPILFGNKCNTNKMHIIVKTTLSPPILLVVQIIHH